MAASDALHPQQFAMMRPSELLPYAGERSDKMSQAKVNAIADSIQQHGYRARRARGNREPITLDRTGRRPALVEGNHRIHAMTRIGYDRPVRVKVVD